MFIPSSSKNLPAGAVWLGHWIIFGAACNVAGWSLSSIHQLNACGLLIAIPLFWFLMARLMGLGLPQLPSNQIPIRWRKRFSSPFPAIFLLLAVLSLIGGFLYAPNNFDALIYRMPRVCHWLMAEQWEWIKTTKNNLNTRSAGIEWWTAPMIAILRTDRLIFLINWVSFLFLPGLFFSLFRHMGVTNKVSRVWMWILPTGYCFVLQAASVGNDMLTAFFAVAAFDFGFRWRRGGGYSCFTLALVSCAMMTAIKPVTLPLLLPFAVLFFGMWKPALAKPLRTVVLTILFAFASFLPTAIINIRQCGDWTGAAAEYEKLGQVEPLVGIITNSINTFIQNLVPPVFPLAPIWNRTFPTFFSTAYIEANNRSFEPGGANFAVSDFQGEETAGIGIGVTLLLFTSLLMGLFWRNNRNTSDHHPTGRQIQWGFTFLLFTFALLAYFSRAGMSTVARHIAPFYPFFFALCLCGKSQTAVISTRKWRWAATFVMCFSLLMVIIVPGRPLWPAHTLLSRVNQNSNKLLQRASSGYRVYSGRSDGLGPLRDLLPTDAKEIGYLSHGSDAELPLWKPYMQRRVHRVLPTETAASLKQQSIHYLVLNTCGFEVARGIKPENWVENDGGIVKNRITLQLLARLPPEEWWVVEIP
jgi:hypothetical protein